MADYIDRDAAVEAAFEADSLELATHGANRIADRIRSLPAVDPAAIRAAALREALASAEYMANRNCVASDVVRAILALIDKEPGNG